MIYPLSGDDLGVYRNENYFLVEWRGRGRIVFSATRKGDAIFFHFASDKRAVRDVKEAMQFYIRWVFHTCKWCKMMLTAIDKRSVVNLAKSVGGQEIAIDENGRRIFMRLR